jgi:hypothetical protein
MRSKREEAGAIKQPLEGGIEKKRGGGSATTCRSTTRRSQENGGEALVRFISIPDEVPTGSISGYLKNPFTVVECNGDATKDIATVEDFTKFHLEDDEMLMELMIHLHADCPDLMNDKEDLIARVSKLYDKIQTT